MKRRLRAYYRSLHRHFGPAGWWPAETPFEIAVGAILTQNAAWTNVEKAIANLKRERLLSPKKILAASGETLETALRPSGYFRIKAQRLRNFCAYLSENHGASLRRMARKPLDPLRGELLGVNGIGPETADDILLYACGKPVFVADAYTRRIFSRHGLVPPDIGYEALRAFFEDHLPADIELFQEYHALIVCTGKDFCRPSPRCEKCPLAGFLGPDGPGL